MSVFAVNSQSHTLVSSAIEAFRAILDRGVRAETINKVRVRVPPAYAGMIATRAEPGARQSTMVSVAHQIATKVRKTT